MGFLDKLLGSTSEAQVKKLMPMVKRKNELEGSMEALTDKELRAKTDEFELTRLLMLGWETYSFWAA